MTGSVLTDTDAVAASVLARAARDGERFCCTARISLAIVTLIAWFIYIAGWMDFHVGAADGAVMTMSSLSLIFGVWMRRRLAARPVSARLNRASVTCDAVLVVGGLAVFVAFPPARYEGIAREPGLALAYVSLLASGIRLERRGVTWSASLFGPGVALLLVGDAVLHPELAVRPAVALTIAGVMLTCTVFAWLIAEGTRNHVALGARNSAERIERLNLTLEARQQRQIEQLQAIVDRQGGALRPGDVVHGFRVEQQIGRGGMGRVFRGFDTGAREAVAIKVIAASTEQQLDAARRFVREAEYILPIRAPGVARLIWADITDAGQLYIVQELVDGRSIAEALRRREAFLEGRIARIGAELARALVAVHASRVIHRDIKESNVMLTRASPGLKLIDFGVATRDANANAARHDDDLTGNRAIGTPKYMAPEQAKGGVVDGAADIYAVGGMLNRLAKGNVSGRLVDVIDACMMEAPHARPTASELAGVLDALAADLGAGTLESYFAAADAVSTTIAPPRAPLNDARRDDHGDEGDDADVSADVEPSEVLEPLLRSLAGEDVEPPPRRVQRVGRYVLLEIARRGVWRAENERGRDVCVAIVERGASPEERAQFLERARRARDVEHENLCCVLHVGEEDDVAYLAMDGVDGVDSLASIVAQGPVAAARSHAIVLGVARAIACAHEAGVAHGAVDAEHVFVDDDDCAVLVDLGVHDADKSRDVRCLGALVAHLLTNDAIEEPTRIEAAMRAIVDAPIGGADEIEAGARRRLAAVALQCCDAATSAEAIVAALSHDVTRDDVRPPAGSASSQHG